MSRVSESKIREKADFERAPKLLAHVVRGLSVFDGEPELLDWLESVPGPLLCLSGVFRVTVFCECCAGDLSRAARYILLLKEMLMLAASKGTRLVLDDRDMRGDALEFQARLGSPKEAESAQSFDR